MKEELKEASIEPLLQYFDKLIPLDKAERNLVRKDFIPVCSENGNMCCRKKCMYTVLLRCPWLFKNVSD